MSDQTTEVQELNMETGTQLFHLADKIINLIRLVVWLLVFYGVLIVQPHEVMGGAANQLKDLILSLWRDVTPYVARFASLVAPIFVLIFALGILHRLGKNCATPFDSGKLLSDLPSTLALIIIATICLLPLAGLVVPDVLNNVALVVVAFYFGKRKTTDAARPGKQSDSERWPSSPRKAAAAGGFAREPASEESCRLVTWRELCSWAEDGLGNKQSRRFCRP